MLNGNNLRRIKMNKKFKCILSILASAAIISTFSYNSIYSAEKGNTLYIASAENVSSASDFTYTTTDKKVTITGYTGSAEVVNIPFFINGYPVIAIANSAFAGNKTITKVKFLEPMKTIGYAAFSNCTSLESVELNDRLEKIESYAFSNCTNLKTINFESATVLNSIGSKAFYRCISLINASFPDSLEYINQYAFQYCSQLKSIKFNKTTSKLNTIGIGAFYFCGNLTSAIVPDSTLYLNYYSFGECYNLSDIDITTKSRYICDTAFSGTPYYSNNYTEFSRVTKACTGNQVIVSIFLNEPENDLCTWNSNRTIENKQAELDSAANYIKTQASCYGRTVNFITASKDPSLKYIYEYENNTIYAQNTSSSKEKVKMACENMRVFSDSEREKIQKKYPHHNIIYVIIIPHSYGRSFAMPSLEPSKAFVYAGYNKQSNEFAHEILHLYGAKDYYSSAASSTTYNMVKKYYSNDLFFNSNDSSVISPPQAFNVGWMNCIRNEEMNYLR